MSDNSMSQRILEYKLARRELEKSMKRVERVIDDRGIIARLINKTLGIEIYSEFFILNFTPNGVEFYPSTNGRMTRDELKSYLIDYDIVKKDLPELIPLASQYLELLAGSEAMQEKINYFSEFSN